MHKIFLALGSNVGDKKAHILHAIGLLQPTVFQIQKGLLYQTKPWGYLEQDNFFNTVIMGNTHLSPEELLVFIKKIEKEIGRIKRFQNGPREIDIDILFYDDLIYQSDTLIIPHPRLEERDFVLRPLLDVTVNTIFAIKRERIQLLLSRIQPPALTIIEDGEVL